MLLDFIFFKFALFLAFKNLFKLNRTCCILFNLTTLKVTELNHIHTVNESSLSYITKFIDVFNFQ